MRLPGVAVFGGVSSHRPTSIPTVCYVLFSAALIAPAAMLLLLLAETLRRSRLRLTQFLLRRRSRTTHPTAWRRLSNDVAACRPWHTETRKLHVDGRVPRRAWPPRRRQRRVPRRSGQHGPSPEEECLRSRPRCSEVTQLQEQGPHRKQPNWVRMCYVLFSYSILMCTRCSCAHRRAH